MATIQLFEAANGRTFAVALIQEGDAYGRDLSLTAEAPLVEFWDTTHGFGLVRPDSPVMGQFTGGRYLLQTMLERPTEQGLCLMGGEPAWTIDGDTMGLVHYWLFTQAAKSQARVRD